MIFKGFLISNRCKKRIFVALKQKKSNIIKHDSKPSDFIARASIAIWNLGRYLLDSKVLLPSFRLPNTFLQFLFLLGTIFGPILVYLFARKYRKENPQDAFSFFRAFSFTLSMYMAATLLVAVAHYIYFKYIDQGYLINMYQQLLGELKNTTQPEMGASLDQITQAFDLISTLTPLQITFQLMSQNMFYGILLSAITAFIVKRKKINI